MQEICQTIQEFLTAHGIPDWLVVFLFPSAPFLNADWECLQQLFCFR